MLRSLAALVFAALTLAGCGAAEASTPQAAVPTPSLPCSLPYGTHVALLSPVPGSTGVTPGSAVLVVASHDLPKTVTLVATDAKGGAGQPAVLERTAPPAHAGRAPFPNPVYYRAAGVGLRPHRGYTVALDDLAQNGCAPYAAMAGDARFST
jgi:hypothetical protein